MRASYDFDEIPGKIDFRHGLLSSLDRERIRRLYGRPNSRPGHTNSQEVDSAMKGRVLEYSVQRNVGVVAGDDDNRYEFPGDEWNEKVVQPTRGMVVDFDLKDGKAVAVYPALAASGGTAQEKSKVAAGILAVFLGWMGAHKFYLGYNGAGVLLLAASIVSFLLWIVLVGVLGTIAIEVLCLVEGILYLTKSDEDFYQTYVVNTKQWL